MLKIRAGTQCKKDLKKFQYNKFVLKELDAVLKILISEYSLDEKYKDHSLKGVWRSSRECQIKPDVLLIYRVDQKLKELIFGKIGVSF